MTHHWHCSAEIAARQLSRDPDPEGQAWFPSEPVSVSCFFLLMVGHLPNGWPGECDNFGGLWTGTAFGLSAPMLGWIPSRIEYHAEQTATVQLRSDVSDYGHSIWNHLGGDGMGSTVAGPVITHGLVRRLLGPHFHG